MIYFKKLKYIIFDDYGVFPGVKQIIHELLVENILVFERFIGINNVPSNNGVVKGVYEGVICKVTKRNLNKIKNFSVSVKQFNWKNYINRYPDLLRARINTEKKALRHWELYGKKENRNPY
jgi:hypothetical protein